MSFWKPRPDPSLSDSALARIEKRLEAIEHRLDVLESVAHKHQEQTLYRLDQLDEAVTTAQQVSLNIAATLEAKKPAPRKKAVKELGQDD